MQQHPASSAESRGIMAALIEEDPRLWKDYIEHPFVQQLGDGSLPEACFRHYLIQDYLFLKHFARAYALAVYKSETLYDMRRSTATLDGLINTEMELHVRYCAGWGISEADMAAMPEETANMAYTRFVLERGLSGDLLDLLVALAPCVVGYGEIGERLSEEPQVPPESNPYQEWIDTYGGPDYQDVTHEAIGQLHRVAERRIGVDVISSGRWSSLVETFQAAIRLEIGFWEMGLNPPDGRVGDLSV